MKKTVIKQIIERLEDAQKHIMANTDYATGYDGALSDSITVCESFLESEKEQIIQSYAEGWMNPSKFRQHGSEYYYKNTFGLVRQK